MYVTTVVGQQTTKKNSIKWLKPLIIRNVFLNSFYHSLNQWMQLKHTNNKKYEKVKFITSLLVFLDWKYYMCDHVKAGEKNQLLSFSNILRNAEKNQFKFIVISNNQI